MAKITQPPPPAGARSAVPTSKAILKQEGGLIDLICLRYSAQASPYRKTLDAFLAFFLIKGILLFIYGILTRVKYRTFLGGFLAPVTMFVLVMSLRGYPEQMGALDKFLVLFSLVYAVIIFFLADVNFIQ